MDKKIYLIDLDNTLIHTNRANNLAYEKAIKDLFKGNRGEHIYSQIFRASNGRITKQDLIKNKLCLNDIDKIVIAKNDCFKYFLFATRRNDNLYKKLQEIKRQEDTSITLVTNANKQRANELLAYYETYSLFENVIYCGGIDNKYEYAINELFPLNIYDFKIEQAHIFDDDYQQILNAKKYGFKDKNLHLISQ